MNRKAMIQKGLPYIKNRYLLTFFIFLLWITVFDQNNLIERFKLMRELHQLQKEKQYYLERIEEDSRRFKELKTNNENLEKFAREEYLMKKKNEDLFIIKEKQ